MMDVKWGELSQVGLASADLIDATEAAMLQCATRDTALTRVVGSSNLKVAGGGRSWFSSLSLMCVPNIARMRRMSGNTCDLEDTYVTILRMPSTWRRSSKQVLRRPSGCPAGEGMSLRARRGRPT